MFDKLGMMPVVAPENEKDIPQAIHITHNPLTGKLDAKFDNLSGLAALQVLADTIYAEYKYSFWAEDHPPIVGYGKVCLELTEGELTLRFGTGDTPQMVGANPLIAKAMLIQAWLRLCELTSQGEFDPRQALIEGLQLSKGNSAHGNRNDY